MVMRFRRNIQRKSGPAIPMVYGVKVQFYLATTGRAGGSTMPGGIPTIGSDKSRVPYRISKAVPKLRRVADGVGETLLEPVEHDLHHAGGSRWPRILENVYVHVPFEFSDGECRDRHFFHQGRSGGPLL